MFQFLVYFGLLLGLIPLLLLIFLKIEKSVFQRLLPVYLLVFVSSFYELVFSFIFRVDVRNWFQFYDIVSFLCYTYYFYLLLNKRFKFLFLFFIIVFLMLYLGLYLPVSPFYDFHFIFKGGFCSMVSTIVYVVCSSLWFRHFFLEMTEASFFKQPDFYIVAGLNIYYSGTLFLFLIADAIHEINPKSLNGIWTLNILLNIMFWILLTVALFVQRRKQMSFLD